MDSRVAGHSPAALRWASGGMVPWYADDDGSRMSRAASPPPGCGSRGSAHERAIGFCARRSRAGSGHMPRSSGRSRPTRWNAGSTRSPGRISPTSLSSSPLSAAGRSPREQHGASASPPPSPCGCPPAPRQTATPSPPRWPETVATDKHHDMFAVLGQMDAAHPRYPHWYLPWFAVDIALQGTGLGTQLMEHCYGSSTLPASPPTSKPPTRAASPSTSVTVSRSPVKRRPERARRSRSCCEPRDRRPRDPAAPRYPRRARPLALPASSPRLC